MIRNRLFSLILLTATQPVVAATVRVPGDHPTIQAAIEASGSGDTILVAAGKYRERITLKPGIRLRSEGDDTKGTDGLRRAEATILDGGGEEGSTPGVVMAEGSTLDGFTITHVGLYDDALWKRHFDSQGEELGDDEGSVQAEGTTPAISIQGVSCTVQSCIVHHNGDVGIGILGKEATTTSPLISGNLVYRNLGGGIGVAEGAEPIIRGNVCKENLRAGIGCRRANPIILDNECFLNVRAGIGCREGAQPLLRGNRCYQNRRAGIGIRMDGTAPVVEANACYENEMAGIGCRDGASPILRNNVCHHNRLAGIGCHGASPLIVGNECTENEQAGIGLQGQATAVIEGNRCHENRQVAIGVTGGSTAVITQNELSRTGGVPPILAVRDDSTATIRDNRIAGGGVAAVLVQGTVTISGNRLTAIDAQQGKAIWIWEGASATVSDNRFDGYQTALSATKATVSITGNRINRFQGSAIVVKGSPAPVHIVGNTGVATEPGARMVDLQGVTGTIEDNLLTSQ